MASKKASALLKVIKSNYSTSCPYNIVQSANLNMLMRQHLKPMDAKLTILFVP